MFYNYNDRRPRVKKTKTSLSRLELEIMQPLWRLKQATIREIREALPEERPPGIHDGADDHLPVGGEGRG